MWDKQAVEYELKKNNVVHVPGLDQHIFCFESQNNWQKINQASVHKTTEIDDLIYHLCCEW